MPRRTPSAFRSVAATAASPRPAAGRILASVAAAAGLFLAAGTADAVTVSGQVVDEQGFGIFNVDLDFFDRNTGQIIFTPGDNTDFGGFYSVDVPLSEYDITFRAPNGSPYLDQEVRVDVTGPTTVDMVLPVGIPVTGTVTDNVGTPLFQVDLDFFDIVQQTVINTALNQVDNTDASGNFTVLVPAATYDVRFTAPLGQPYPGVEIQNVTVTGAMSLGTVVLPPGFFLSGAVKDPSNQSVQNQDLDVEDVATGDIIYTPRDNTDDVGHFDIAVPAGTFDVIATSPAGSGWAWRTLYDVSVSGNMNLGNIQLQPGSTVSGTVLLPGGAPSAVGDMDAIDRSSGKEINMPNDNTAANGTFGLLVATGTQVDVAAYPPAGVTAAAGIVRNVNVTGDLNVGTIQLVTGFSLSGTVTSGGAPVAGADLDAFDLNAAMALYPTGGDKSAADGTYGIRLPAGNFLIVARPPLGSADEPDSTVILGFGADTVHDFMLGGGGVVGAPATGTAAGALRLSSFPNPFTTATTFSFDLPAGSRGARVGVYDTAGRLVRLLDAPTAVAGTNRVTWDGRDGQRHRVASGVYLYRLDAAGGSVTRKVVVLR